MNQIIQRLLSVPLCLVLLFAVTGCQSNSNSNENSASTPEETKTRTVSTVMGDIEVPVNPQRVVVNWYIGEAFTLGLNVVGSTIPHSVNSSVPYYNQIVATPYIEQWEPEEVMSLEPDLIITHAEEDFNKFGKIAPVLVVKGADMTSVEQLRFLGEATGHTAEAEKAIAAFETKLAAAKAILNTEAFEGKTISINEDWGSSGAWAGISFESASRGGTLLYDYLGQHIPEKVQGLLDDSGQGYALLSYEVAHEYFGDYIVWSERVNIESEYKKTEIWNNIPAVKNKNVITISGEYGGLFVYSDVLSLTAQMDFLVDALNTLAE